MRDAHAEIREYILQRTGLPPAALDDPQRRLDELGFDSLAVSELVFDLEERFGIRLPDDGPEAPSIGQVLELIGAALNAHVA